MNRTLQFQGEKSPALGPKIAIISWYLLCVAVAVCYASRASKLVPRIY